MADVVKRKIAKAKAKATFTNLRRGLLVAIDEPDLDKDKIKYNLVLLENGLNAVMEIITELSSACSTSQDSVFLDGLCKDADYLENQYTDAVTRASTVLASMSRYNSTCTSEATGVRYSRNPDRVREYLESRVFGVCVCGKDSASCTGSVTTGIHTRRIYTYAE